MSALTVTSGPAAGAGFQLTAMVTLSDRTSEDVTRTAVWTTSNSALAQVSDAGLVTVLSGGDVDFSATYESTVGSLHVVVVQTRWTVTGVVSTAFPNLPRQLPGVTVAITYGRDTGLVAVTDANGRFAFANLQSGVVNFAVVAAGYSSWTLSGLHLARNQTIDPTLFPTPPSDATGAGATAQCNDASWSWTQSLGGACDTHGGVAWPVCPGPLCPLSTQSAR